MTTYNIEFQPIGRRGQCQDSDSLLDAAHLMHVGLTSTCGGAGTCNKCKIKIASGPVTELTDSEVDAFTEHEIRDGWRLACQTYPLGDVKIHVPAESMTTPQRTQVEGYEVQVTPEPPVKTYQVKLTAPTITDQQSDGDRLVTALSRQHGVTCDRVDFGVLQGISPIIRPWGTVQAAVRGSEVIAVAAHSRHPLGLAVDLGSTKIAGYLVDIEEGRTLAAKGAMNPQISFGEDVISRIAAAVSNPEKGTQMQKAVVEAIDQLAAEMCGEAGVPTDDIVEAVLVANTAMHHLFLALPVKQLATNPFIPAIASAVDVKARELGFHFAPGAYVHILPNIAGFVGADHVAMLLATNAPNLEGPLIALDIGTNTEVSLVYQGKITATSCASGPAFEGGHVKDGMRASRGAIERVRILKDKVEFQTIDDAPPVGICGSGILDTMAQLYLNGIIDKSGRMHETHRFVRSTEKGREFVLAEQGARDSNPTVVFTQHDVRQLQLGKGAIRTGIQMLLESNECSEEALTQVIIAGAFGSYIDVASVVEIGMLPLLPLECFHQVGNAAGMGAKQALISMTRRAEAQSIASRVRHIELRAMPYFDQTLMNSMSIGRFRLKHGKKEEIS
ncbi:MAG: DUF4445 domain-containing protein [Chloroflexi bacterium]|nr:DUF4445 domain-containing protein [Chloroflexota bacterium]